jgi:hypothetical protein
MWTCRGGGDPLADPDHGPETDQSGGARCGVRALHQHRPDPGCRSRISTLADAPEAPDERSLPATASTTVAGAVSLAPECGP